MRQVLLFLTLLVLLPSVACHPSRSADDDVGVPPQETGEKQQSTVAASTAPPSAEQEAREQLREELRALRQETAELRADIRLLQKTISESAPDAGGFLTVNSVPEGQVFIDGKLVTATTPLLNHPLGAGKHSARLYYAELKRFSDTKWATIRDGNHVTLFFAEAEAHASSPSITMKHSFLIALVALLLAPGCQAVPNTDAEPRADELSAHDQAAAEPPQTTDHALRPPPGNPGPVETGTPPAAPSDDDQPETLLADLRRTTDELVALRRELQELRTTFKLQSNRKQPEHSQIPAPSPASERSPQASDLLWRSQDVGGSGGRPFQSLCPEGSVAVGVYGKASAMLNALGILCGAPDRESEPQPSAGGRAGTDFVLECPRSYVLVGLEGTGGGVLDSLRGICQEVQQDAELKLGEQEWRSDSAGGSGGKRYELRCPNGSYVQAIEGRSGAVIDSVHIACATGAGE